MQDIIELKSNLVKSIILNVVIYYLFIFNLPLFYLGSVVSGNKDTVFNWFIITTNSLIATSLFLYIFSDNYNHLVFRRRSLLLDLINKAEVNGKANSPSTSDSLTFKICVLIDVERQCEAENEIYDEASISKSLKLTLREKLFLLSILSTNFNQLDRDYKERIIRLAKPKTTKQ